MNVREHLEKLKDDLSFAMKQPANSWKTNREGLEYAYNEICEILEKYEESESVGC